MARTALVTALAVGLLAPVWAQDAPTPLRASEARVAYRAEIVPGQLVPAREWGFSSAAWIVAIPVEFATPEEAIAQAPERVFEWDSYGRRFAPYQPQRTPPAPSGGAGDEGVDQLALPVPMTGTITLDAGPAAASGALVYPAWGAWYLEANPDGSRTRRALGEPIPGAQLTLSLSHVTGALLLHLTGTWTYRPGAPAADLSGYAEQPFTATTTCLTDSYPLVPGMAVVVTARTECIPMPRDTPASPALRIRAWFENAPTPPPAP